MALAWLMHPVMAPAAAAVVPAALLPWLPPRWQVCYSPGTARSVELRGSASAASSAFVPGLVDKFEYDID
jgi:hypothetical protein